MRLFSTVGVAMGMAIRTSNHLPLNLPPLFWKLLAREPPATTDLDAIDTATSQTLGHLRAVFKGGSVDASAFSSFFQSTFTVALSDKRVVRTRCRV